MNQIQQIESEVEALQTEIGKLESRRTELSQSSLPSVDCSSSETLLATIENADNLAVERRKQMQNIDTAIAHLKNQISPKLEVVQQMKRESQRQAAQERVELAQTKIRGTLEKIKVLASDLEAAYWELKQHYKDFNGDYRASQIPGFSSGWSPSDLINFRNLPLPQVQEQGDRFIVDVQVLDIFKPERDAGEIERRRTSAANKQNRQRLWEMVQHKEAERLLALEADQLRQNLEDKRSQLNLIEREKAELLRLGAKVGKGLGLKIDPQVDNQIARLKQDIAQAEAKIEQIQQREATA